MGTDVTAKDEDLNAQQRYRKKLRLEALVAYGMVCQCCGEYRYEFLCIDHMDGGGNAHRKEVGGGGNGFLKWLRDNNYPEGYQTLCHNCNFAKHFYGKCPHEADRED